MDKVRFGVLGTNFITDWVITGATQDPRFELTAVCSRTKERAAEFALKHHIPYQFTSLEEMACSPLIDAVYIATPNFRHADQSILCMSHGKHVLCEKPLASNAKEAEAMIAASKKYNVTLMEAMKPTLMPSFKAVIANIGRVGTIRRYFSSYCQYSSRYDAFKEGKVANAFNPACSNGAIMDIGVYTIYPMIVLFGMPQRITASGIMLSSGTDGQGTATFLYNDMEATVLYSKIANSYLPTEIQGEDGIISINRINQIEQVYYKPRFKNIAGGKGIQLPTEDWTRTTDRNEYYYEVAEFIDLVLTGKRESSINSHQNSLGTLKVMDEIRKQVGVVFPADKI